jgi:guanylate kinase
MVYILHNIVQQVNAYININRFIMKHISVGRCTLIKKLMESNPRHYQVPVRRILMNIDNGLIDLWIRDTLHPMRSGEWNGREYHFISCEEMEQDIQANKFL